MKAHFFETFDTSKINAPGEWCKHCNCAKSDDSMEHFDRDTFSDYVVAHGSGEPTPEGYALAERLLQEGDTYSTAAWEIVHRGLTYED